MIDTAHFVNWKKRVRRPKKDTVNEKPMRNKKKPMWSEQTYEKWSNLREVKQK